jgi:tRNA (mo5U34)-methyltransferase
VDTETAHALLAPTAGRWWHSIDLGPYGVTGGHKKPRELDAEWEALQLPALAGKSVLDIGTWDGYFAFRAEREGAAHVTALDHYIWSFDPLDKIRYEIAVRQAGGQPEPPDEVPELWKPDALPGKLSFDAARAVLESNVEPVVADFMGEPLENLPQADIVLFLGVLYHLKEPFRALERLRHVTRELAVIETEAIHVAACPDVPLAEFLPADTLQGDPTNWWAPTMAALVGMAEAAGFSRVEPVGHRSVNRPPRAPPAPPPSRRPWVRHVAPPPRDPVVRYRPVVHAWV